MFRRCLRLLGMGTVFWLAGCVTKDRDHHLVVSIQDQSMKVYRQNTLIARYAVSTSKFGVGDWLRSDATPLGRMEVEKKIGAGAPSGAVFKSRRMTGEILKPDAPGRDPIVTRILWLKGLEPRNQHAFDRYIYIHGTPEERNIGRPASYGCIRMRSRDVIALFNEVGVGAVVDVVPGPLAPPAPVAESIANAAVQSKAANASAAASGTAAATAAH